MRHGATPLQSRVVGHSSASCANALHGIRLLGHCSPAALDVAASLGERLSALIVSAYLNRFRAPTRCRQTGRKYFTRANVGLREDQSRGAVSVLVVLAGIDRCAGTGSGTQTR